MSAKPSDIKDGIIRLVGKGGKFATVPVSERLRSELDQVGMIDANQPFVASSVEKYDALRRACKMAKIDASGPPNFHRFRHSFASNLLRAGVSVKAVQALMRHDDVRITLDTYGHLIPNDLHASLDKL